MTRIEDLEQPTEEITQACPSCGRLVTAVPYDIGSGPEMSCGNCEWCWGANGQSLKALDTSPEQLAEIRREAGVTW